MAKSKSPSQLIATRTVEIRFGSYEATNFCQAALTHLVEFCPKKLLWPTLKEFVRRELEADNVIGRMKDPQVFAMVDAILPANIDNRMFTDLADAYTHDFEDDWGIDFDPLREKLAEYVKANLEPMLQAEINDDKVEEEDEKRGAEARRGREIEAAIQLLRVTGKYDVVPKGVKAKTVTPKTVPVKAVKAVKGPKKIQKPTREQVQKIETWRGLAVAVGRMHGVEAQTMYVDSSESKGLRIKFFSLAAKSVCAKVEADLRALAPFYEAKITQAPFYDRKTQKYSLTLYMAGPSASDYVNFERARFALAEKAEA